MRYDMPEMETKQCYLRPLEEGDACDMFAYCSDGDVTAYLSYPAHTSVNQTLHIIQRVMLPYWEQQDFETWAIIDKESEKMIGHIQLHSLQDDRSQVGYTIAKEYWGKGIAKEVLRALLHVAFTRCGLHRVEALYDVHHTASAKVLQSCGFTVEGVLKKYMILGDNKYHDMVLAAILENEWKENMHE